MTGFLRVKDIAELFDVDPVTVRKWRQRGWLKGKLIGNCYYFDPTEVQNLIRSPEQTGASVEGRGQRFKKKKVKDPESVGADGATDVHGMSE